MKKYKISVQYLKIMPDRPKHTGTWGVNNTIVLTCYSSHTTAENRFKEFSFIYKYFVVA